LVGGSLASSLHGIPRATQDVDMVAGLKPQHEAPFVKALHAAYFELIVAAFILISNLKPDT
jgi:hypothetical protein